MIKEIVLILTRKCSLNCSYCCISGHYDDYILKPDYYPSLKDINKNEKNFEFWKKGIEDAIKYNQDIKFVLTGGEVFNRQNLLISIINYFKSINFENYTIESSLNEYVLESVNKFFNSVGTIPELRISVESGMENYSFFGYMTLEERRREYNSDEIYRSITSYKNGLKFLKENKIKKLSVNVMCDNKNISNLESTLKNLSKNNIYSYIRFVDYAKTGSYDFSSLNFPLNNINKTENVEKLFNHLYKERENLKIENSEILLKEIDKKDQSRFPSNWDCNVEDKNNFKAIGVDFDGRIRLCKNIRGRFSNKFSFDKIFVKNEKGEYNTLNELYEAIISDKEILCNKCIDNY